ncbi:Threonyl/alanyl tRNA synthetase, partial [Cantharellus anzutake]|uniref:Threonyl/alanyl tRNA synthetase n=1 Tax=Cantharellus anzutake TaxID=1750568 RepID=UPI001906BF49
MPSIVGNLACQRNSYLRRLETTVVSCVPSTSKNNSSGSGGSKENFKSIPLEKRPAADLEPFEIEFEDTVLFPEGGGQPEDHGLIKLCEGTHASQPAEILITRIARHGLRAVHFSSSPLEPGTKVVQEVSWDRRWDHMQQHTGQHLLSAVMDTYQGLETLGWSMGASPSLMPNMNFVELGRKPTDAEISEIQHRCNSIIAENRQVTVDTPSDADTTSLPSDYDASQGLVRVVKIDGIDENPCCGTHLSQTSHISLILISHTQPIRGTNTRLYFTCGQRAITLATYSIRAARSIAGIVSASISDLENVISKVTKIDLELRDAKRAKRRLEAELAKFEAENIKR